jgi:hypothetical protein
MAKWFVAPSLKILFDEINSAWPNRDKSTDGTIGDAAHSSRDSQHNPNDNPNDSVPDGAVTAADIDKDGINVKKVLNKLIGDDRVWYVIYDGVIWSRTYGWAARKYNGSNPHKSHIHVSLVQSKAAVNSKAGWGLKKASTGGGGGKTPTTSKPVQPSPKGPYEKLAAGVKPGKRHTQVRVLQRLLIEAGYGPIRGAVTNYYGENTEAAVRRFHKANPQFAERPQDSVIGPKGFQHLQKEADK